MTWMHINAISSYDSFLLINMNWPHQHKIIPLTPPREETKEKKSDPVSSI